MDTLKKCMNDSIHTALYRFQYLAVLEIISFLMNLTIVRNAVQSK